tara:strand:- start:1364 stop:1711 length:348 start_codon:yes stop_codon:yes gene_type:complete
MTKTDTHKAAMVEAMEKSLGIVTSACKAVGIARQTHYEWMRKDDEYKALIEAVADIAIDFGESHLHKLIKNGSPAATIFFLKTKGKKRGYVERQEIETTGDNMFNVQILDGDSKH